MLQDTLTRYLSDYNPDEKLVQRYDEDPGLDWKAWESLVGLGLTAILVPGEQGGLGMDMLTLALLAEAQGAYAVSTPMDYQCLAAWSISNVVGSGALQSILTSVLAGELIVTLAMSEGNGHAAPGKWTMAGGDSVSGRREFVPFAADADYAVLPLEDNTLALIDLEQDGVTIEMVNGVDRSRPVYTIMFDKAQYLSLHGCSADRLYDATLILHAADAFGAAKRCLDLSVDYAKTREQFGQQIGKFQALKHQLALMALDLEPTRYLFWYAAHCWDTRAGESAEMAALVKAHMGEVAVKTGRASVEAHGGIGFTWEYPIHIWLKRAMYDAAVLGSPGVQRIRSADLAGW